MYEFPDIPRYRTYPWYRGTVYTLQIYSTKTPKKISSAVGWEENGGDTAENRPYKVTINADLEAVRSQMGRLLHRVRRSALPAPGLYLRQRLGKCCVILGDMWSIAVGSMQGERANFTGLILGCIDASDSEGKLTKFSFQRFSR